MQEGIQKNTMAEGKDVHGMRSRYEDWEPRRVREQIRSGAIGSPTAGMCAGYAQGNLVVLERELAWDFLLFCQRNPKSCPLLEVADAGSRTFPIFAPDSDIATDVPKYRVYENGICTGEYAEVVSMFESQGRELVSFLIGCSFSFEAELMDVGIPVRHIEEGRNVPMYDTGIPCIPAGRFTGNMVVSVRPIPHELVPAAAAITASMPRVHGAPVQIGYPEAIGIKDISRPDYGDAVTIMEGEVPVFWPCGVTPQAVVMNSKPEFAITHAPGHMFITDVKNVCLKL